MAASPKIDGLGAYVPGSEEMFFAGAESGPLKGLTFSAKDIFDVAGWVTGCGNPDWARTHDAAKRHADMVSDLLNAGADLRGKTITDELAYSINGQNYHYGTPANTNAPGRIPGGSSSGSASAVAGGVVDFAIGSDTGGSIRIPASYCGIYGLRPSHGRISLEGVMPLAPSYDTGGWFTRDASLLRQVGEVLFAEDAAKSPEPMSLLVAEDAFAMAEPAVREALMPYISRLEAQLGGAGKVSVCEAHGGFEKWMLRFRAIQASEIWRVHGEWISQTKPTFGPEIAERFAWVQTISEAEADEARGARVEFTQRMNALLPEGQILCLPTAPGIAPKTSASAESLREHRSRVLGLTCISGLSGLPQVSLPVATVEGCPVGLSLIAPKGADMMLLSFAEAFVRSCQLEIDQRA